MLRRSLAIALLLGWLTFPTVANATWSIVAVDRANKRVTMALATCFDIGAHFLSSMLVVVVPGKGVAACQATVDPYGGDQKIIYDALQRGDDPASILAVLRKNPKFAVRQFGIVDMTGRAAAASGDDIPRVARTATGHVPGTQIYYSIQGNTLTGDDVVADAVKAFVSTPGGITDRAMAALEAGDRAGGDSRCKCEPGTPGFELSPPCDGRHSQVAFIVMSESTDKLAAVSKDVVPAMFISVSPPGPNRGADQLRSENGDSINPVKTLRKRYDAWRAQHGPSPNSSSRARQNPGPWRIKFCPHEGR